MKRVYDDMGKLRISTRDISKILHRENGLIVKDIDKLLKVMSRDLFNKRFLESTYIQSKNKKQCREYLVSADGVRIIVQMLLKYKKIEPIYNAMIEIEKEDQHKLTPERPQFKPIEQDIKNENGQIVVSSRDVAERFGKRHADVIRVVEEKMEINAKLRSSNYFIENTYVDSMNRPKKEFLLTRDGFTFIAMGFTGKEADDFKLAYIEAFNKMEEALKKQTPILPTTYKDALMALVAEVEAKEALQLEVKAKDEVIEVMKPKVDYHDNVLDRGDLLTITCIAKDLGFKSGKALNDILIKMRVIYKAQNGVYVPYAGYDWLIKEGYADYRVYAKEYTKTSLQWTEKGRKYIHELLKENNILPTLSGCIGGYCA